MNRENVIAGGYYSTGQLARLLGISPEEMRRVCDDGLIRHHMTPGGHRRVAYADAMKFCAAHRIPAIQLEKTERRREKARIAEAKEQSLPQRPRGRPRKLR